MRIQIIVFKRINKINEMKKRIRAADYALHGDPGIITGWPLYIHRSAN